MSTTQLSRGAFRIASRSAILSSPQAIGPQCRKLTRTLPKSSHHFSQQPTRSFSLTPPLSKKAGKANKAHAKTDSSPPVPSTEAPTSTDEAYDVSGLEARILEAIEKLTHELRQLRSGGRVNTEVVENLKVSLGTAGQGKESVKLGDIAQVFARGRVFNVVVGEESHIKPVNSAIASSPHSLTPLPPDSNNPLTILIPLPPPTGETRRAALEEANTIAEKADKMIQMARQDHNKRLRKFELNREVLPDDLQKAKKRMEGVVKKGHEEVKRICDGAKRVLESQ